MRATCSGYLFIGNCDRRGASRSYLAVVGRTSLWLAHAFYFLGFPGLLLAVIVFSLKEQRRGRTEVIAVRYASKDWKIPLQSVPLRYLFLGYGLFGLASNNLGIWVPSFFVRVHGISIVTIGIVAGVLAIVVGVPVTIFGGYISDRLRRFGKGGAACVFSMWAALASIPLWLMLLFGANPVMLFDSKLRPVRPGIELAGAPRPLTSTTLPDRTCAG